MHAPRILWVVFACLGFSSVTSVIGTDPADAGVLQCHTSADCDTVGAECSMPAEGGGVGVCTCPRGEIMSADMTSCLPVATEWGATCEDTVQCTARLLVGGRCDESQVDNATQTCVCAPGFHYLRGQCWLSAGLGEECSRDESCFVNGDSESVVCSSKQCKCAEGFYQREYSSCRRIAKKVGDECGIAQDCHFSGADCIEKLCACAEGFKFDPEKKACVKESTSTTTQAPTQFVMLQRRRTPLLTNFVYSWHKTKRNLRDNRPSSNESTCSTDSDCRGHSGCIGGICVCDRGYFRQAGSKDCLAELSSVCTKDSDCHIKHSLCRKKSGQKEKRCSCRTAFVPSVDQRICRKMTRELGWSCLHDEQCGNFGPRAVCQKKKCRCGDGTHYSREFNYCWVSTALNATCRENEDCAGLGPSKSAGCLPKEPGKDAVQEKVCRCLPGHHVSADGKQCRPDATSIGSACEADDDCVLDHTRCGSQGTCECGVGYLNHNGTCLPGIGGPCTANVDCSPENSECKNSTCACQEGYVGDKTRVHCLRETLRLGDSCQEDAQCETTGSLCETGRCRCAPEKHFRDGFCWNTREVGERCTRTSECYQQNATESTECRNGLCECRFEYVIPGSNKCKPSGRMAGGSGAITATSLASVLLLAAWTSLASRL